MTTVHEEFIVQGRVHTFLDLLIAALGAGDKYFLLVIDTLAFASSSLFLSAAWLFSKGKSTVTVAFSIGLCVGSTTACVVQISRRSFERLILNYDDGYSTCKSPRRAGYSKRSAGSERTAISDWRAIPEVSDLGRFAKWN